MKQLIFISLSFFNGIAFGQVPENSQRAALRQLNWLIGEWSGSSVVNMGGKKSVVSVKETVQPSLDSTIFIITGRGTEKDTLSDKDIIVHDAFAVVSYDEAQNKFRWNAWRMPGGTYGQLEIKLGEKSFEWSTQVKGGQTRYKAYLNEKNQWVEVGEFSSDGLKWYKYITMTLNKIK